MVSADARGRVAKGSSSSRLVFTNRASANVDDGLAPKLFFKIALIEIDPLAGTVEIEWCSAAGETYVIQCNAGLSGNSPWTAASEDVVATGRVTRRVLPLSDNPTHFFYRVVVKPEP